MCAREEGPHTSGTTMVMMWEGGRECEGQRGSKRMRLVAVSVVLSCLLLLARCCTRVREGLFYRVCVCMC